MTVKDTEEQKQRLEDWRALRVMALAKQWESDIISQEEFLHDVRQALQG